MMQQYGAAQPLIDELTSIPSRLANIPQSLYQGGKGFLEQLLGMKQPLPQPDQRQQMVDQMNRQAADQRVQQANKSFQPVTQMKKPLGK